MLPEDANTANHHHGWICGRSLARAGMRATTPDPHNRCALLNFSRLTLRFRTCHRMDGPRELPG